MPNRNGFGINSVIFLCVVVFGFWLGASCSDASDSPSMQLKAAREKKKKKAVQRSLRSGEKKEHKDRLLGPDISFGGMGACI